MTLRKESREDLQALDILIGTALRESVARAEPSPRVWERIKERLEGQTATKRATLWQSCRVVCKDVASWLWRASVLSPAQLTYYNGAQGRRAMWEENYLYYWRISASC